MFYEKKMLILTGEGTGVVLVEKSALGASFFVRTFDLPPCGALKAGVITKKCVFVRDLPPDNAAEFVLECDDIAEMHFVVFDDRLRLYGATGKRMWEANIMELLLRHDKVAPPRVAAADTPALPPISPQPKRLPLPDGTGLPQSRLELYGDEAISSTDFYTPFELAPRLERVDAFLDTPRVLDGLSPLLVPPETAEVAPVESEICRSDSEDIKKEEHIMPEEKQGDVQAPEELPPAPFADVEAAATALSAAPELMPWEAQARWIKRRGGRELKLPERNVRPPSENIKKLRETSFFERVRADVDELFAGGERDGALKTALPDFEWVKVPVEGGSISVGRSGATLCYAVEGVYDRSAPLGPSAQWLPSRRDQPEGRGYWLLFQDLATGEMLESVCG